MPPGRCGMGEMTHPCPAGQGYAASVRDRRCLPCGQKRFRVGAPDFGRVAGESGALGRFAHQERLAGAPGERKHTLLRSMRPPSPRNHPAGRMAGSARTRSRDSSLENPFLGDGSRFPAAPVPQRRRRQAPARGLAAVYSLHRPNRTETQNTHPLLVGWVNPSQRRCQPALPARWNLARTAGMAICTNTARSRMEPLMVSLISASRPREEMILSIMV